MNRPPNFDRIAPLYRWLEYLTLGPLLERTRLHHLPALALCRRAYLLGDGDGRFTAALLARYPQLHAHAVDLSPRMLALLRARTSSPNLTTTAADALTLTPNPAPDLIVTHFFLDCLTQAQTDTLVPHLAAHSTPASFGSSPSSASPAASCATPPACPSALSISPSGFSPASASPPSPTTPRPCPGPDSTPSLPQLTSVASS